MAKAVASVRKISFGKKRTGVAGWVEGIEAEQVIEEV